MDIHDLVNWSNLSVDRQQYLIVNTTTLAIKDHPLFSLPDIIGELVNLKELSINKTRLSSLPDTIGKLVNLEKLYIEKSELCSLPETIGNLVNLNELSLSINQLTSLPDTIGNLVNLKILKLYRNNLSSLPEAIWKLYNLKELDIGYNQLSFLSDSIGNLSLRRLMIDVNEFSVLPYDIHKVNQLLISNNPNLGYENEYGDFIHIRTALEWINYIETRKWTPNNHNSYSKNTKDVIMRLFTIRKYENTGLENLPRELMFEIISIYVSMSSKQKRVDQD